MSIEDIDKEDIVEFWIGEFDCSVSGGSSDKSEVDHIELGNEIDAFHDESSWIDDIISWHQDDIVYLFLKIKTKIFTVYFKNKK